MILVTSKEMQNIDSETIYDFGLPGFTLMENAGKKAYEILIKSFKNINKKKIGVVVGKGNNGGDGLVVGRYLINNGFDVEIFLTAKKQDFKKDAKKNLLLLTKLIQETQKPPSLNPKIFEIYDEKKFKKYQNRLREKDVIVDAIFGTGLKSDVKGIFKTIIDFINSIQNEVFSIDIPSGINSDTGKICLSAIKSNVTVTFALPKIGHFIYDGYRDSGKLYVVDIGIPEYIIKKNNLKNFVLDSDYFKDKIIKRDEDSHKGKNGHILTFAGNRGTTGALIMLAMSALRVGAGLVSMVVSESINDIVEAKVIEGMTIPFSDNPLKTLLANLENKNVVAMGSGLGKNEKTKKTLLNFLQKIEVPVVLDADALNFIAEEKEFLLKDLKAEKVLTPHPKEMARLVNLNTQEVQKDRIDIAKNFAVKTNSHVILKGNKTVIVHPDGEVYININGNSGMATGGMGDVLCGMVAGFVAQGYSLKISCHLAVFLHGLTGDTLFNKKGSVGFLPTDLIKILPQTIKEWKEKL